MKSDTQSELFGTNEGLINHLNEELLDNDLSGLDINVSSLLLGKLKRLGLSTPRTILAYDISVFSKQRGVGARCIKEFVQLKEQLLMTIKSLNCDQSRPDPLSMIPEAILNANIELVNVIIPGLIRNKLNQLGLNTVRKLLSINPNDFTQLPGVGKISVEVFNDYRQKVEEYVKKAPKNIFNTIIRYDSVDIKGTASHAPVEIFEVLTFTLLNSISKHNNVRDADIIRRRYGFDGKGGYTLEELGTYYDVTRERVRQIVARFLKMTDDIVYKRILKAASYHIIIDTDVLEYLNDLFRSIFSEHLISRQATMLRLGVNPGSTKYNSIYDLLADMHGFSVLEFRGRVYYYRIMTRKDAETALKEVFNIAEQNVLPMTVFEITIKALKQNANMKKSVIEVAIKSMIGESVLIQSDDQLFLSPELFSSAGDLGYRILVEHGSPMHRTNILKELHRLYLLHGSKRKVSVEALTNQLSNNTKVEPIGKTGLWALKEWGVQSGSINEIIWETFTIMDQPLSIDELYEHISQSRSDISKKSIASILSLYDYIKIDPLHFIPKLWSQQYKDKVREYNQIHKPRRRAQSRKYNIENVIEELLSDTQLQSMPLRSVVSFVVDTFNCSRSAVYRTITDSHRFESYGQQSENRTRFVRLSGNKGKNELNTSILKLIQDGEGSEVEFKSSLLYDRRTKRLNKELVHEVLKTIVAFLNTSGGILLIGVSDDGKVLGLESDMTLLKNPRKDSYKLRITDACKTYIDASFIGNIEIEIELLENKHVCAIKVRPGSQPAFLKKGNDILFYIRSSASSHKLNPQEQHRYIQHHFKP